MTDTDTTESGQPVPSEQAVPSGQPVPSEQAVPSGQPVPSEQTNKSTPVSTVGGKRRRTRKGGNAHNNKITMGGKRGRKTRKRGRKSGGKRKVRR